MGETTTLERPGTDVFPPATFEESVVETSPEIEATKANIEHTRAEMSETINAIKEQLSPKRLVEDAKEAASEAVAEKVTEVKDAVMDKVSDIAHGASDIAHNVVASVTGAAHSLGEKVSELTGNAKDKIHDLTHSGKSESDSSYPAYASYGAQSRSIGAQSKQVGDVLMDTIKENPIPAALVGVGLGWLLVDAIIKQQKQSTHPLTTGTAYNGHTSDTYGDSGYGVARGASYGAYTTDAGTNNYATAPNTTGVKSAIDQAGQKLSETGEKIGDAVDGAKAKIGDTVESAKAKIGDTAHDLQAKASDLAHTVQDKAGDATALVTTKATELGHAVQSNARKATYAAQDFVTDNPLAAGAIALLVGTVIGLALPATEPENKLMGTYRDQLADQAGQQAQDLLGKVQSVAGEAMDVAKDQFADVKGTVQTQLTEAKDKVQDSFASSAKTNGLVTA
ncbi:MAG: DUF3618 domain-containing protein [Fibrella sp.]|nr:DUF3618 domain-containing protein [Armatimonadota bacterium]